MDKPLKINQQRSHSMYQGVFLHRLLLLVVAVCVWCVARLKKTVLSKDHVLFVTSTLSFCVFTRIPFVPSLLVFMLLSVAVLVIYAFVVNVVICNAYSNAVLVSFRQLAVCLPDTHRME